MKTKLEIDPLLSRRLASLRDIPARDPNKAALGRENFLKQAAEMAQPVSAVRQTRHNRWMHPIQRIFSQRNEGYTPMFGTIGTIILIVTLVLGGGGVTVAAAQNSLPDDALDPVKIWSGDIRSGLTQNDQTRIQLAMDLVDRRAEEIAVMLRAGQIPPDSVQERLQAEVELAITLAVGQKDPDAISTLRQIRERIEQQEQVMLSVGEPKSPQEEMVQDQIQNMMREQLRLCDYGITDPQMLREHLRYRLQNSFKASPTYSATDTNDSPWTTGTPTPGSSYGPGPGDGNGDGNPWTTGTPTPGSSYGPNDNDDRNGGKNPWVEDTPVQDPSVIPSDTSQSEKGGDGEGNGNGEDNSQSDQNGNTNSDNAGNDTDDSDQGAGSESGQGSGGGNESGDGGGKGGH